MHPHLEEVFAALDESRVVLHAAVARVAPDARARKPAADRWSVNEILEHLGLVEARFAAMVGEAIAKARAAGLGPEREARAPIGAALEAQVIDRAERRQAPPNMIPTGALDETAAWLALDHADDLFRSTLRAADGLALGTVMTDHRRWGALTAYQWAEVIAAHRRRHAEQIAELADEKG